MFSRRNTTSIGLSPSLRGGTSKRPILNPEPTGGTTEGNPVVETAISTHYRLIEQTLASGINLLTVQYVPPDGPPQQVHVFSHLPF